MKTCSKCRKELQESEFTRNRSKADGLNHSCKKCHSEYTDRHYKENKSYYVRKANRYSKTIAAEIRKLKSTPCMDCGKEFPYFVMDFDHRENKKFNLSEARRRGLQIALKEAEKCDIVCANCHRIRTHQRGLE